MKPKLNLFILFLALGILGLSACSDSSISSTNNKESEAFELDELASLVDEASKEATNAEFEEWEDNPCFNADSAMARMNERARIQKFKTELTALASTKWSENAVLTRLNNLESRLFQRIQLFEEKTGREIEVLNFEEGEFNNEELNSHFLDLKEQINRSEIDALLAIAYVHEFIITGHFLHMQAKRKEMRAIRLRFTNGEATACDSLRMQRMAERAQATRQAQNRPQQREQPERGSVGQNGPLVLQYIIKYLKREGITYEFQLLDPSAFTQVRNGQGQGRG